MTTTTTSPAPVLFGVAEDYSHKGKRQHLTIWSGSFMSVFQASARQNKDGGFTITTYWGEKLKVSSPDWSAPRTDANWVEVDEAINKALNEHNAKAWEPVGN